MTRETITDFQKLQTFVCEYSLSRLGETPSYIRELKRIHKVYFSLLSWHCEFILATNEIIYNTCPIGDSCKERINETISDIGSSIFCWINGAYKPSKMLLRSAIENICKGLASLDDSTILTEQNLYKVFERAKVLHVFVHESACKQLFDSLHADYGMLCSDVHTAHHSNMINLSSLSGFPSFKEQQASDTCKVIVKLIKNITLLLCFEFPDFFHSMHHRNKENILESINSNNRRKLLLNE